MMDCLKPKPEPKRRVPACEDADAISSRIAEIARSEGREPHRLNPAEMKRAPAETGDLYGIGLCLRAQWDATSQWLGYAAAICGEHEDGA